MFTNLSIRNINISNNIIRNINNITKQSTRKFHHYTSDVVIIGGGAIGCSTALELQRKGYSVSVVEANPGVGQGSTSYSSGICRMYYSIVDSVKFSWEGYQTWKEWQDYLQLPNNNNNNNIKNNNTNLASLKECGVMIFDTPHSRAFLEKTSACLKEVNIPYSNLTVNEVKQRFPQLSQQIELEKRYNPLLIEDNEFAISLNNKKLEKVFYMKDAGFVNDPLLAVENIRDAIVHQNNIGNKINLVTFYNGCKVTCVNQRYNSITGVELSNGNQISSPIVINCGGPHSNLITDMVYNDIFCDVKNDMKLTTRPLRREICHLSLSTNFNYGNEGMLLIDFDNGIYVKPENNNNIIIGSNEPPCDKLDILDNVEKTNINFTEQWTSQLYRGALRMKNLRIPSGTNTRGVVACYDITEDWTPIYDRSNIDGYYMAIGTSGNQFKNIGVVGQLMSELVELNENGRFTDKKGFDFKLKRTNNVINTKCFSRLRKPNSASSGTVLG